MTAHHKPNAFFIELTIRVKGDYGNQHRVVRRVKVAGNVPVGVDGRASVGLTTGA